MFDFSQRKNKRRNILYSKPLLVFLGIVVIGLMYSVYGALEKERDTRVTKDQRATVLNELHERQYLLQEEIDRLQTEKGIESEIRSKFEVARDGEEVIVIVDAAENDSEEVPLEEEKGFWQRLFGS